VIFSVVDVAMIISPLLLIHHLRDVRRFNTYMIVVGLVATASMLVFGAGTAQSGYQRVTVGLASPLVMADAASFLVICVVIALICRPNALTWLLGLPAIALGALATYRTGSRGQLAVQVLAILLGVYLVRKHRPALATVTAIIVIVVGIMATAYVLQLPPTSRYSARKIVDDTALRWEMTRISFENWTSRVLIGYGPGDSAVQLRPYLGDKASHPHNMYVAALNELGLIGALPLFGFWLLSLAGMRRAWRYASTMAQRQTVMTIICLTAYYLMISTKTGTYTGSPLRAFLFGMGLVLPQVLSPSADQASLAEWDDLPDIEPAYSDTAIAET
jgi:O-antigen ligase